VADSEGPGKDGSIQEKVPSVGLQACSCGRGPSLGIEFVSPLCTVTSELISATYKY